MIMLHVHVLVHFFEPVFALLLLLAPLDQAARRLALDPVRHRRKDDKEPEKPLRAHLWAESACGPPAFEGVKIHRVLGGK